MASLPSAHLPFPFLAVQHHGWDAVPHWKHTLPVTDVPLQVSVKRNEWSKAWVCPQCDGDRGPGLTRCGHSASQPHKRRNSPPCEAMLLTARFAVFLQLQ